MTGLQQLEEGLKAADQMLNLVAVEVLVRLGKCAQQVVGLVGVRF